MSTALRAMSKLIKPRDTILAPLNQNQLPSPREGEPLFHPAGADRLWYMGFLQPWADFNNRVIRFWKSTQCRAAFGELQSQLLLPPRSLRRDVDATSSGAEQFSSFFQREVLEVVQAVCNKLLQTRTMRGDDVPEQMYLGKAADEDLGNAEVQWTPSFVVKARERGGDDTTRVLGQVEYLGGRDGGLVIALDEVKRNTWGSLRCVLGKLRCSGGFVSRRMLALTFVQVTSHSSCCCPACATPSLCAPRRSCSSGSTL